MVCEDDGRATARARELAAWRTRQIGRRVLKPLRLENLAQVDQRVAHSPERRVDRDVGQLGDLAERELALVPHEHHFALLGRLDVVMVPVDGSMTMSQSAMVETLQIVKARLILPMHYFGVATLSRFLTHLDQTFDVEISRVPEITVSVQTLPPQPKVLVLPGY